MSNIKPCPFCDVSPEPFKDVISGTVTLLCPACGVFNLRDRWNTRPIEDALAARVAELEAEVKALNELMGTV